MTDLPGSATPAQPKRPRKQKTAESPLPHFSLKDTKTLKNFYASARARWLLTAWPVKLGYYAGLIVVGGIVAYLANSPAYYGAAAAAAAGVVAAAILTAPDTVKTVLVLAATAPLYWFTSVTVEANYVKYVKTTQNIQLDFNPANSLTGYIILTVLSIWVALLWGKGKLWFTILLLQLAGAAIAAPLSYLIPQYGTWLLYGIFAIILTLRCGSIFWTVNTVKDYREKNHPTVTNITPETFFYLSKWDKRSIEEKRIDKALAPHISEGQCVIADVRVKEGTGKITRCLITRKGIFLIINLDEAGPLQETPGEGLALKNTNFGELAKIFATSTAKLAKILKTSPHSFRNVVVLSGKNIPADLSKEVIIYNRNSPLPKGYIQLVSPNTLENETRRGENVLTEKKTRWVERYLHNAWQNTIKYVPQPAPATTTTIGETPGEETFPCAYRTTAGVFGPLTGRTHTAHSTVTLTQNPTQTNPANHDNGHDWGKAHKRKRKLDQSTAVPHHLIPEKFTVPANSVLPHPDTPNKPGTEEKP